MKRIIPTDRGLFDYTLIQAVRKNVLLQALPEGKTRVYAPKHMRLRDVDELVRQHASSLREMHRELDQKLDADRRQRPVSEGSRIAVEGRLRTLKLERGAPNCVVTVETLHLTLPTPEDESAVRAALKQALSRRALERIRERIDYYHPAIGSHYGRVTVRDQRSRWGSCSSRHNLNFNWKLIMAPPRVLDYVVIHELCHLWELNHSQRFWQRVCTHMPDYQEWRKWLKTHGNELGI